LPLRPLLFGAAWKILDLLIEWGLHGQGVGNAIQAKADHARQAVVPNLSADPRVWSRIAGVYAGTVEQRHCLVHRSFAAGAAGDMTNMLDRHGAPIIDLNADEQIALSQLAQRCVQVVRDGFTTRTRAHVEVALDGLHRFHGLGRTGPGVPARVPLLITVNAALQGTTWTVDLLAAKHAARRVFPAYTFFDLEIHFPGSGLAPLRGSLDAAPNASAEPITPSAPPPWIDP
jgi:hypothetical protein